MNRDPRLLYGADIRKRILDEVAADIARLATRRKVGRLVSVGIGEVEEIAVYIRGQARAAAVIDMGINQVTDADGNSDWAFGEVTVYPNPVEHEVGGIEAQDSGCGSDEDDEATAAVVLAPLVLLTIGARRRRQPLRENPCNRGDRRGICTQHVLTQTSEQPSLVGGLTALRFRPTTFWPDQYTRDGLRTAQQS